MSTAIIALANWRCGPLLTRTKRLFYDWYFLLLNVNESVHERFIICRLPRIICSTKPFIILKTFNEGNYIFFNTTSVVWCEPTFMANGRSSGQCTYTYTSYICVQPVTFWWPVRCSNHWATLDWDGRAKVTYVYNL